VEYLRNGTTEISLPFSKFSCSSLSSAENNNEKSDYKWKALSRLVGLLILEKPLPFFNGHPNRFILTNVWALTIRPKIPGANFRANGPVFFSILEDSNCSLGIFQ